MSVKKEKKMSLKVSPTYTGWSSFLGVGPRYKKMEECYTVWRLVSRYNNTVGYDIRLQYPSYMVHPFCQSRICGASSALPYMQRHPSYLMPNHVVGTLQRITRRLVPKATAAVGVVRSTPVWPSHDLRVAFGLEKIHLVDVLVEGILVWGSEDVKDVFVANLREGEHRDCGQKLREVLDV